MCQEIHRLGHVATGTISCPLLPDLGFKLADSPTFVTDRIVACLEDGSGKAGRPVDLIKCTQQICNQPSSGQGAQYRELTAPHIVAAACTSTANCCLVHQPGLYVTIGAAAWARTSSCGQWPRPDLGATPRNCDIAGSTHSKRLTDHVLFASLQGAARPSLFSPT